SFYGKEYWNEYQYKMGLPDIESRARQDFSERVLYWLRVLLKYKLPAGTSLEIGCAHGAFVRLLQEVGFNSMGLELSPWVAEFAKEKFAVPVLVGPIEEQNFTPASLDIIIMMDVLEHLPYPSQTINECRKLLKPDGILLIQTPCFPALGDCYSDWQKKSSPFLDVLRDKSHLFLFSNKSIRILLNESSFTDVVFEPALFSQYDMFLIAGKGKPVVNRPENIYSYLESRPETRCVLGLLDLYNTKELIAGDLVRSEKDRADRLQVIERVGEDLRQTREDLRQTRTEKDKLEIEVNQLQMQVSNMEGEIERLEKKIINRIYSFVKKIIVNPAGEK
ncbi:methyltransferase domain-containing protein, partial [bacterium]|nr:methyltransferase domain-containing protein [bacterium]